MKQRSRALALHRRSRFQPRHLEGPLPRSTRIGVNRTVRRRRACAARGSACRALGTVNKSETSERGRTVPLLGVSLFPESLGDPAARGAHLASVVTWGTVVGMRRVLPLAVLVLAVSCGGAAYGLPDRTDDRVRATEHDLAQVVGAARGGDDCDVRLLGESDGSSFVWAECFGASGGISAPMRVDGDEVQLPGDGNLYDDGVRRLFPAEVADAILTDQERLKP